MYVLFVTYCIAREELHEEREHVQGLFANDAVLSRTFRAFEIEIGKSDALHS